MERHNTNDLFKKILENPPPMRPDLEALEDMNRRLDVAQKPKVRLWWVLPLLLFPMLFCSLFFYDKYQAAQKSIHELNLQLTNFKNNTSEQTETEKIIIYQYDTIFTTVYREVLVQRNKKELLATLPENRTVFNQFSQLKKSYPALAEKGNTFDNSSFQPSQLELLRNGKALSLGQMAIILNDDASIGVNFVNVANQVPLVV